MPRVSTYTYSELSEGWQCASLPAEAATEPSALERANAGWIGAPVPGTVASALRASGRDVFRDKPPPLDASDHWYRTRFAAPEHTPGARFELEFDGLATLSEVWLNGERILQTDNMFEPARADVTERLRAHNELAIRFRSLDRALAEKRPRPRWRTRIADHTQLRWIRTSLVGRMPGWTPPLHAVGPWRPVRLIEKRGFDIVELSLSAEVSDPARRSGRVRVQLALELLVAAEGVTAELVVGDASAALRCTAAGSRLEVEGELNLAEVKLWWPHTHGAQPLYPARVLVRSRGERQPSEIALGSVGFRTLELDREAGRFQLRVNGAPLFCRGACWTTTDAATLTGTGDAYARDLERARAAGMNMLRISGTLFYEAAEFYRRCSELGILIWQDFMFANMDYPIADREFAARVDREVDAFLRRTQAEPALALLCGGSEVEQQVAMMGLPRTAWKSALFDEVLPAHVQRLRPDVPYWPNSPSGGDLPFEANGGVTHYYGVGAYLRPLEDARRAEVRFASECLAFANVPDDATIADVLKDGQAPVHHPAWKERVPRDVGASWDFEDVRDHYLKLLFGHDPNTLRYVDPAHYLALSRIASGEVIANALGEWRRERSSCQGALVWFYRDFWPGAGLGLLDANGRPKAAFYYLKRALAPTALWFSDEGLNGLHLHVAHEAPDELAAELQLTLHHDGNGSVLASERLAIELPAFGSRELRSSALLPWFADVTRAYRFGPPAHDLVSARLVADGRTIADAVYFPLGYPTQRDARPGLAAIAVRAHDAWQLRVTSERLAFAVEIDAPGYEPADNFFHLPPGGERIVELHAIDRTAAAPAGSLRALNSTQTVKIAREAEREPAPRGDS